MLPIEAAARRDMSARTVLLVARAVQDSRPFCADEAFLLLREVRRVCPVSLADSLSEERLEALECAADDRAYLDLLARYALSELIARLQPVGDSPQA